MYQFILPDIGEGVVEAEILTWHVAPGDYVGENHVIVDLMTDKATVEIPSPKAGFVQKIFGQQGDIIEVGQVLIEIDDSGEANEDFQIPKEEAVQPEQATPESEQMVTPSDSSEDLEPEQASCVPHIPDTSDEVETPAQNIETHLEHHPPHMPARPHSQAPKAFDDHSQGPSAVPAVREFAKQNHVDLALVCGSGPMGRIMKRDVQAFLDQRSAATAHPIAESSPSPSPEDDPDDWTRKPLRGLRRAISNRMSHSVHTAAHYTYVEELDITALMKLKQRWKDIGHDYSPLAFVSKACIQSIPDHPMINACMDDERGEVILKEKVHLGVATATQDGLVVPVIHDCQSMQVSELSSHIADLAERARNRKLKPEELKGGTFTISSLGKLGGLMATPVINYPQAAILGVHKIQTLPRYINNALQPRQIMNISISLDHRIIDGYEAALFIEQVKTVLENADFEDIA